MRSFDGGAVRAAVAVLVGLAMAVAVAWWKGTPPPPRVEKPAPSTPPSGSAAPSPVGVATWPTPFSVASKELPPPDSLPPGTIRILVLGDSVASFLGVALRYRQDEARAFVAERGVGSCSIFPARTRVVDGKPVVGTSCSATWARDTEELRPDVTLLVLGGAFLGDQACEPAWLDSYEQRILTLKEAMGASAGRVVLTRVPYPMGGWRHGNVLGQADCYNEMLRKTAGKARLPVLDLMGYLCRARGDGEGGASAPLGGGPGGANRPEGPGECMTESQGRPIRPDGLHFDGVGAEETARWVLRELRRMVAEGGRESPARPE